MKSIVDMTVKELSEIKSVQEYEAEAFEKYNPHIGDTLLIHDNIRSHNELVILEDVAERDKLLHILAPYGHSITSVLSIIENYGNIGSYDEVKRLHPEYFI